MSGLNTLYIPLSTIQEQFWDKETLAPMAGGVISFYKDTERTVPKPIYYLSGSPPDYTDPYPPFGESITLSAIGTLDDGAGNNLVPYLYPYDANGNTELYYITVYNSDDQFQFSVGGVPNIGEGASPESISEQTNYITNGQFLLHRTLASSGLVTTTITNIAYGGWRFIRSSNSSTDHVLFPRFGSPLSDVPSGNPRYACKIDCTVPNSGDQVKMVEVRFEDVNRFSSVNTQKLTLFFNGKSTTSNTLVNVNLYKYFGSGGSTAINIPIASNIIFTTSYVEPFVFTFDFESNVGQTLGAGDDDYFAIQIKFPPVATFDVSVTDFALFLGEVNVATYPFTVDPLIPAPVHYQNEILTADTTGVMAWTDTLPSDITISDGLVTDPTTSSSAIIDTALANIQTEISNLSIPLQTYSTGGVGLSGTKDTWQAVTGATLLLNPGTYILSYSCSIFLNITLNTASYISYTKLVDTTSVADVPGTTTTCCALTTTVQNAYAAGSSSVTITITPGVASVYQIYARLLGANSHVAAFSVDATAITAIMIG